MGNSLLSKLWGPLLLRLPIGAASERRGGWGMGAVGLWIGLAAGLLIAGVSLITVWAGTIRRDVGRGLGRSTQGPP